MGAVGHPAGRRDLGGLGGEIAAERHCLADLLDEELAIGIEHDLNDECVVEMTADG